MSDHVSGSHLRRPPVGAIWAAGTVGPVLTAASVPTFGYEQSTFAGEVGPLLLAGGLLVTAASRLLFAVLLFLAGVLLNGLLRQVFDWLVGE